MAVVTISRDLGSGGRKVGSVLAEKAGYRFLDHEGIVTRIKTAGHRWEKWAEEFDEHSPWLWEKYDWSYRGLTALIQSTILDEALLDNVVIIGRGANFLLRDIPFALSVRIVAPLELRISRVSEREAIEADSARWLVEKTDRQRAGFLYTVYGKDGKNPADYDMLFDSGTTLFDEIVAALLALVPERDRRKDDNSLRELRMRAVAARIKARLLTALPFFIPTVEAVYEEGHIHLRGVVRLPRERDLVVKEAKNLAGDAPLKIELRYRR